MWLLTLLSIFILVFAQNGLTLEEKSASELCPLGPLYSCQNLNTSLQCDTFNECIFKWQASKSSRIVTDDFYCHFCSVLMTDLQKILNSSIAQEEAVQAVNRLCEEIPNDGLKTTCHIMANMYLKTALDMLSKDIDPRVVCHAVKLCPGSAYIPQNFSEVLRFHIQQRRVGGSNLAFTNLFRGLTEPNECNDCKAFISDVKARLINNVTKEQLEAIFDEAICTALPVSLQNLCRQVVHMYVEELVMMMDQELDSQEMCTLLGFCTSDKLTILKQAVTYIRDRFDGKGFTSEIASTRCAYCKGIVSRARMLLEDPNAKQRIEALLKSEVCIHFTSQEAKCKLMVELYVPILIDVLLTEVDPMVICESIHMCPDDDSVPSLFLVKQPFLLGNENVQLRTEMIGELSTCQVCDVLLRAVHKRNVKENTKAALITTLRQICDVFHDSVGRRCHQIVDHYHKPLVRRLLHAKDDTEITCPLSECHPSEVKSDNVLFQPHVATQQPKLTPPTKNGMACELCKQAVVAAEKYVKQNHTEEEIVKYLESWCQDVPKSYQDTCVQLVKAYAVLLIDEFIAEADPQTICTDLDLCVSSVHHKLLGRRRCTWGPSYWCASLLKAHRCQAMEHCQKNVWLAEKPNTKAKST